MDSTIFHNMLNKHVPDHFMTVFETQHLQNALPEPRRPKYPYHLESDEKREARLAANRERMRNIRLNESPEQKEARQAYNRIRSRLNLIRETAEERQKRLASNRERMKANRERYSEQRRKLRELETPEMREARLAANRERVRNTRLFETDEQKERRRTENRERQRLRRAQETPEEVEIRRTYNRARMSLKRSLKKYKDEVKTVNITLGKPQFLTDADVDADMDYVIPDVVINMVDEVDSKEKFKQNSAERSYANNTITTYDNDTVKPIDNFLQNKIIDIRTPTIGNYIHKCITTIDNILNSETYQSINTEQQQTITDTALGIMGRQELYRLPQEQELSLPTAMNVELPSVIRTAFNISSDKKYNYI